MNQKLTDVLDELQVAQENFDFETGKKILDKKFTKILEDEYTMGYKEGLNKNTLIGLIAIHSSWILGLFAVLFLFIFIMWSRVNVGYRMDSDEAKACASGQYTGCLLGIERYAGSSRAGIYQKIYQQATGKDIGAVSSGIKTETSVTEGATTYTIYFPNGDSMVVTPSKRN